MASLQRGKKYWIAYCNGQGEASERVIHVRAVTAGAYGKSYIRAFCELAGEERTFRLDRMTDIELLDGPLSETTSVTQRRNSSYLGPSPGAVRASAPAASPPAARNSAPERSHGFRRFLLKAAAIFILFDFVITDDPGRMSGRLVEAVESMVDPHPGLHRPTAITDVSERDAARPVPTPSPEPLTVAVSTETQEAARAFNVSASRVREVENLSLPPGWSRISVEEYHGVAIDGLIRDGEYRYHVRRTDGTHASLREARKAIRIERLARKSEVKHELVISRYDRADLDHDDELSWRELRKFQEAVFRDFRYESNGKALRPEEFFLTGGGDCEDFAIFSAAMLTYWGWDAYVASMGTNDSDAHAVVFIKVDRPPAWASFYEIPKGTGNPRFAASGTFVPVDYDVVGGLSNAVTPGSTVTDIVVPRAWYGLAI